MYLTSGKSVEEDRAAEISSSRYLISCGMQQTKGF